MKRLKLSLRGLMLIILLLAVVLGWLGNAWHRVAERDQAIAAFQEAGGFVRYVGQTDFREMLTDAEGNVSFQKDYLGSVEKFFARTFAGGRRVDQVTVRGETISPEAWRQMETFAEFNMLSIHAESLTAEELSRLKRFSQMEYLLLDVMPTTIGEAEADVLTQLTSVKYLGLPNDTDQVIIERLQAALPNCRVRPLNEGSWAFEDPQRFSDRSE